MRVFAPDAAWVSPDQLASLPAEARAGFWPISPAVVIEIGSQSDPFAETVAKIRIYCERGTQYGVAIDPFTREVFALGAPPRGLELDLDAIIDA